MRLSRVFHGVRFATSSLMFAFSLLACSHSLAAPGALEEASLLRIAGGDNKAITMTVQPDGRILAAGYAYFGTRQFAITRYNPDGSVDATFGDNGTRLEWLGPGNAEPHGIGVQSTGQVVVGGFAVSDMSRFGLARFNSDGTLDTTFGGGGAVTTIGNGSAALAMALQSDDRIVLGGWSLVSGRKVFTLARYEANAPTLDTTFGSGGVVVGSAAASDQQINSIAIQTDGRIVAAGDDGSGGVLVRRYNGDGSLDTSFGTGGTFTTGNLQGGRALAILAGGDILVAGEVPGNGAFEVMRLTPAGALDTSFGISGFGQQGAGSPNARANALAVQSDGKIVVAGTGATASAPAVAIARFDANGANDTGFGNSGVTIHQFTASADEGNGLAILASGELVVAGTAGTQGAHDALLAGFTTAGALDASFGTSGSTVVDAGSKQSVGLASALQSDGKLVVAGFDRPTPTAPSVESGLVARYNPDGSLDATFGTGGFVETAGDRMQAVAVQSDGKIVIGGYASGNFNGSPATHIVAERLNPDGTVDSTFGGGTVIVAADGATEQVNGIAIQSDGRIVLAGVGLLSGSSFTDSLFVRLNTDGSLDSSFGGTGKVRVSMSTGTDLVNAIAIQTDGRIVGAGWGDVSGSQDSVMVTRLNTDGSVDTSFGTSGVATTSVGTTTSHGNAVALQPDGRIVVGGQWFDPNVSNDDFLVARYLSTGALDTSFGSGGTVTTDMGNHNRLFALMILANGKIVGAGHRGDGFALAQYLPGGALDTTFGASGTVYQPINAGADIAHSIVLRSDGKYWVSGDGTNLLAAAVFTGDGGTTPTKANPTVGVSSSVNPSAQGQSVTFTANVSGAAGTPTGTVAFLDGTAAIAGCSSVALSGGVATCATSALASGTHTISASYSGDANYNAGSSSAMSQVVMSTTAALAYSPASVDFGGESMGTTSPPQAITVTNGGSVTVTISSVATSSQFSQSNDCSSLAPGASCTITVAFTPSAAAGAVNTTVAVTGTITVTSSASGTPDSVPLSGSAEKSLVTHFYESILGRAPDAGGKSFWEGQADNMVSLGADVNEVWYAMASQFFSSTEYLGRGRDNTGFVTDLYDTFFNRPPDASGLSFWVGQLDSGMPREVVLVSFELSPEFTSFCQGIFGNTAARAEVNVVMDFYRGLLARLPDSGGFNFWVGQFRTAQCQGASAVYNQVESISSQFADGTEYANRNRSNAQYVGDLYNAFLRRGGDQQGVQFWIQQLDSGAQTRDQVRQQFIASPEFTNRVNAVINQGCMQ